MRIAVVTGAVSALVLGAGIAWGAPGDGDEIAGCYHKNTGALRVVDSGAECGKNELPISWSKDTQAPSLADGSVKGGLGGVVLDESLTSDDLGAGSVTGSELAVAAVDTANLVAGSVKGGPAGVIDDDSVTGDDLASSAVGRDELASGSVGSDEIENGSVASGDLAGGAVTTDKLTAGVQSSVAADQEVLEDGQFDVDVEHPMAVGPNHKLLLLAQSQVTCTSCLGPEIVEVSWQLFDGTQPVGFAYTEALSVNDRGTVASVQALIGDSGAAGSRPLKLRVHVSSSTLQRITVTDNALTALDLGR